MIDPELLQLARGKNFAVLEHAAAGWPPGTQVMWIDADEESVPSTPRWTGRSGGT